MFVSGLVLSLSETKVLSRGLSFVPKPMRLRKERLLTDLDQFVRKMRLKYIYRDMPGKKSKFKRKSTFTPAPTDNKTLKSVIQEMRGNLSSLTYEQSNLNRNLTFAERQALLALSNDNTIVIKKADKANVIVVQNHDDYAREGFQHLSDASVYKQLTLDTTMDVDTYVSHFVDKLYKDGLINKEMLNFCLPGTRVRTARICFLKKTIRPLWEFDPLSVASTVPLSDSRSVWIYGCNPSCASYPHS